MALSWSILSCTVARRTTPSTMALSSSPQPASSSKDWLQKAPYYHYDLVSAVPGISPAVARLPEATLWSVMERIHATNACHYFMACHPDRPKGSYAVGFSGTAC